MLLHERATSARQCYLPGSVLNMRYQKYENIIIYSFKLFFYFYSCPNPPSLTTFAPASRPIPPVPPLPNILDHDAQNPTVDRKERQPRRKEPGEKSALAEEFEPVGLLQPKTLIIVD